MNTDKKIKFKGGLIGEWQLIKKLGEGAFGTAYEAVNAMN